MLRVTPRLVGLPYAPRSSLGFPTRSSLRRVVALPDGVEAEGEGEGEGKGEAEAEAEAEGQSQGRGQSQGQGQGPGSGASARHVRGLALFRA